MNFYDLLVERARLDKIFFRIDTREWSHKKILDELRAEPLALEGENIFIADAGWLDQLKKFFAAQSLGARPILLHHGMSEADVSIEGGSTEDAIGVLSSGSSGKPKVLFRTFESWADFFPIQNKVFGIDENSRVFIHGSLSFTGNLNVALGVLDAGGTLVTSEKLNARAWLDLIDGCSTIYLVPTKLSLLAALERTVESVETIFTGSQFVDERLYVRLRERFPNARVIVYYGASELNYVTYKVLDARNVVDASNLGRAFDGVSIEIRDGLIYVDNAFGVSGIKMPFSVGDAGRLNGAGELIFEGRGEEFINKGGVKLNAARLESLLQSIEGIEGAAVLKVGDERRGEKFIAFVVSALERREVEKKIRRRLKPIEQPTKIIFVDEIPLNDRGKVDRVRLRAKL